MPQFSTDVLVVVVLGIPDAEPTTDEVSLYSVLLFSEIYDFPLSCTHPFHQPAFLSRKTAYEHHIEEGVSGVYFAIKHLTNHHRRAESDTDFPDCPPFQQSGSISLGSRQAVPFRTSFQVPTPAPRPIR